MVTQFWPITLRELNLEVMSQVLSAWAIKLLGYTNPCADHIMA